MDESWIAIAAQAAAGVGTLILAFFTWRLARSTRLDVEAQWRPLLVPARLLVNTMGGTVDGDWANVADNECMYFAFENVGKGAALAVVGHTTDDAGRGRATPTECVPLPTPVLAVGRRAVFQRRGRSRTL